MKMNESSSPTTTNGQTGYCELALGPMFAGKSSWIVRLYKQYTFYTDKIVVINYVLAIHIGAKTK